MSEKKTNPRSYEDTIASDIFHALEAAHEQGTDVDAGFDHSPMGVGGAEIFYMFYSKKALNETKMPTALKKRLGLYNVLASIMHGDKPMGVFLVCSLHVKFSEIKDESQIRKGIQKKDVYRFKDMFADIVRQNMQYQPDTEPTQ
jgi:hypothetical protein